MPGMCQSVAYLHITFPPRDPSSPPPLEESRAADFGVDLSGQNLIFAVGVGNEAKFCQHPDSNPGVRANLHRTYRVDWEATTNTSWGH